MERLAPDIAQYPRPQRLWFQTNRRIFLLQLRNTRRLSFGRFPVSLSFVGAIELDRSFFKSHSRVDLRKTTSNTRQKYNCVEYWFHRTSPGTAIRHVNFGVLLSVDNESSVGKECLSIEKKKRNSLNSLRTGVVRFFLPDENLRPAAVTRGFDRYSRDARTFHAESWSVRHRNSRDLFTTSW